MQEFDRRLEQEKLAALKELAYGASHEINNPLANIATRAQLLLRDEEHPERRRMLASIHTQAMRAHEMIADLMLFARPPKPELSETDLNELVNGVVDQWRPVAAEHSTDLIWQPRKNPLSCLVDREQLSVALGAVVRNALETLGEGGRVEVELRRARADDALPIQIRVRDNGPGMSAEIRRHAFDPFFSGREAGRGLGFGLSKCWRIIEQHGGEVQLNSSVGKGSLVTLRLPAKMESCP